MTSLLLAPHHDDETLFAAFTIMREKPKVVIVLESHLQEQRGNTWTTAWRHLGRDAALTRQAPITNWVRASETTSAVYELGLEGPLRLPGAREPRTDLAFWPFRDDKPDWHAIDDRIRAELSGHGHATRLFAPAVHDDGHEHHNALAVIAEEVALDLALELVQYTTYRNGGERVTTDRPVPHAPWMVAQKLRALACYRSQIELWPHHFIADQREYYVTAPEPSAHPQTPEGVRA